MSSMTVYSQLSAYEAMQVADALHNAVTTFEKEIDEIESVQHNSSKATPFFAAQMHRSASRLIQKIDNYKKGFYFISSEKMMQELAPDIQGLNDSALRYRALKIVEIDKKSGQASDTTLMQMPSLTPMPTTLEEIRHQMTFTSILQAMNDANTCARPLKEGFEYVSAGVDAVCDTTVTRSSCALIRKTTKEFLPHLIGAATPDFVKESLADGLEGLFDKGKKEGITEEEIEKTMGSVLALSIAGGLAAVVSKLALTSALENAAQAATTVMKSSKPLTKRQLKMRATKVPTTTRRQITARIKQLEAQDLDKKLLRAEKKSDFVVSRELAREQKRQEQLLSLLSGGLPVDFSTFLDNMGVIKASMSGLGSEGAGSLDIALAQMKLKNASLVVIPRKEMIRQLSEKLRGLAHISRPITASNLSAEEVVKYTFLAIKEKTEERILVLSVDKRFPILPYLKQLEGSGEIKILGKQPFFVGFDRKPLPVIRIDLQPSSWPLPLKLLKK